MKKYRVAQVGCGNRGLVHIDGWLDNPDRFELVALCELDRPRMEKAVTDRGIAPALFNDAETMLAETQPDVFCFSTQPTVRLSMVELAARHGVAGLAFEKPMARSVGEARQIAKLCNAHGIKTIVSHQQKYLTSMQKAKAIADSGEIGDIVEIRGTSTCNLTDLGTHFMDYMLWANDRSRVRWIAGHVHGTRQLDHHHPSPDFFLARMEFENGVRGLMEIGVLAPHHMENAPVWLDSRLTIVGTHGFAWADTDSRWGALTRSSKGELLGGAAPGYDPANPGAGWITQEATMLQPLYLADFADWLDDDAKAHPCNLDITLHGFEALQAGCLSALDHTRKDLPLSDPADGADVFERMRNELSPVAPLED
ncbi:Gfo/Idh/MocA family oxidoreductase [bacterium]|nr:Gfo/Idh/MocA family oxidoreductase [bacterium]